MSILPVHATLFPETKTLNLFWNLPAKSGQWEAEQMDEAGTWTPIGIFAKNNSANVTSVSFGFDGTAPLFTIPRLTQRP